MDERVSGPYKTWDEIRAAKGAPERSEDPNERSQLASETFYPGSNVHRSTDFYVEVGHRRTLAIKPIDGDGMIPIPYLEWTRREDGGLSLILDNRLMLIAPVMSMYDEDAMIEFLANCIAVGAGYASIYYTKRKVPFRG